MVNKKFSSSKKLSVLYFCAIAFIFSGCNMNKLESSKLDLIKKTSVFEGESIDKAKDEVDPEVALDVTVGAQNQSLFLDVSLKCSTNQSKQSGNLLSNADAEIEIQDEAGHSVCKITSDDYDIIAFITENKKIDLVKCREKPNSSVSYKLSINSVDQNGSVVKSVGSASIEVKNGQIKFGNAVVSVLFNYNFKTKPPSDESIAKNKKFTSRANLCDQNASPLVIDMRSDYTQARGIDLTSLVDGVLFDLFGTRSNSYPHTKIQISWITSSE